MSSNLLDKIPKAQHYELKDVRSCGENWREMEEVPEDVPDMGDRWVKCEAHEDLRKDMAVAIDVGNTAIGMLTKERDLLRLAHKEYADLLEQELENHDNESWPTNTPANDALDEWKEDRECDPLRHDTPVEAVVREMEAIAPEGFEPVEHKALHRILRRLIRELKGEAGR